MKTIFDTIKFLSEISQVSLRENIFDLKSKLEEYPFTKNAEVDSLGNIVLFKKGVGPSPKKILLEAHRDEIGLCVKEVLAGGYLSVLPCGGISPALLPGTEFTVIGKSNYRAVATSLPPHLKNDNEKKKKLEISDIYLDLGSKDLKDIKKNIRIGAPIRFAGVPQKLLGDKIISPSLDNKASVCALLHAFHQLGDCPNDVYVLLSVGEETTSRGVRTAMKKLKPDFAFVVDAGFAMSEGLDSSRCIKSGGGPSVSFTDTLSRKMSNLVFHIASEGAISLQIIAEPGGTGTSAGAIQLENGGTPSAVISIPVFNMHTPSEIVAESDIQSTIDLICALCNDPESWKEEI